MEENNNIKIYLSTVFLIISLIVIIIMAFFIYKLYNDKKIVNTELMNLNNQITKLENEIDSLKTSNAKNKEKSPETSTSNDKSIDLNNYIFKLDNKNKYTITTDLKWKTMQNDGGSHSSIYYQIDLDNNIISKVQEEYHANLGGTPSQQRKTIYIKKINTNIQSELKSLLIEILTKEDINETHNYNFFTIKSLDAEKDIYNLNTIESINSLLKKIDTLN